MSFQSQSESQLLWLKKRNFYTFLALCMRVFREKSETQNILVK